MNELSNVYLLLAENNERTIEQEPNPSNMDVQEPEQRPLMNPVELTPAVDDICKDSHLEISYLHIRTHTHTIGDMF